MRAVIVGVALLISSEVHAAPDVLLPQVSFQATAIQTVGAYQNKEKIYYADGKLRIERGRGFSTTLLDLNSQTQCILMANHTYLVLPMDDELYRRFFPLDPHVTGARRIGAAEVAGMATVRYNFGDEDGLNASGTFWLTDAGIMVQRDYDDGLFGRKMHHHDVVVDVSAGPQAASLFQIPAGYRKAQ